MRIKSMLPVAALVIAACSSGGGSSPTEPRPPYVPPVATDSVFKADADIGIGSGPSTSIARGKCGIVVGFQGSFGVLMNGSSTGANTPTTNSIPQKVGIDCRNGANTIGYLHDQFTLALQRTDGTQHRVLARGHNSPIATFAFGNGFAETAANGEFRKLWNLANNQAVGTQQPAFPADVTMSASSDTARVFCAKRNCWTLYPSGVVDTLGNSFTHPKGEFVDVDVFPSVNLILTASDSVAKFWIYGDRNHYSKGDWMIGSLTQGGPVLSAATIKNDEFLVLVQEGQKRMMRYWRINFGSNKPTATLIAEAEAPADAERVVAHNGQPAYLRHGHVVRYRLASSNGSSNMLAAETTGQTRFTFTAYHGRQVIPSEVRISR